MHGLHLTADLRGCDAQQAPLHDAEALRTLCLAQVAAAGLCAVNTLFHCFAPAQGQSKPGGVTGVVLLAESHLAVHTWPELGAVTLDVYVCNLGGDNTAAAEALMQSLVHAFAPTQIERHRLDRGHPHPQPALFR
jgi:S-adenosylmethionine decarboxylase proenzyme